MVAIILLAAGNSRRFQKNKLLYKIDGKPMFLHMYEKVLCLKGKYQDEISNLFVVTQYEEIRSLVHAGTKIVWNAQPELGISHSIHLGMEAADRDDNYLFLVCDMPNLTLDSLEKLMEVFVTDQSRPSCLCSEEHYGNPAIFPNRYRDKLFALSGDSGGKRILKREEEKIQMIPVQERELVDLDYPIVTSCCADCNSSAFG